MKKFDPRNLVLWIIIVVGIVFVVQSTKFPSREKIAYSEFKQLLRSGQIQDIELTENLITGTSLSKAGTKQMFQTVPLPDPKLIDELDQNGVKSYRATQDRGWVTSIS